MILWTNALCVDSTYSMVDYDTNHFMALEYETTYYEDLMRKKLLPKRGIGLENMTKKPSVFHGRLADMG